MASESLLEGIYLNSLDEALFSSFQVSCDLQKVENLIVKFRGMMAEYPSRTIEDEGRVPEEMLKKMGEIGLFGISIPEAYGGLGFNLWEYLRAIEEMVRLDISVVLASLAHLSIGVKGIVLFGSESQKRRYLVPAASGEMIFSYALTEPRVGSDAQHIETAAELSEDGSHYILNGQKTYITNANYAGGLTVFAQLDPKRPGYMGAFIVETAWDGVKIGKDMPKMGLKASSTAAIQLENVRVPVENLVGKPGEGFKIAMTVLNYGRLGLGAASVGMMLQSLDDMKKRSSARVQFGVPINSFPLIQEKMVRARVHSLASAAMNDFSAWLLESSPTSNVAIESSHCKLFGTTRCWDVLYDALQVAGGAGYLATQPYEKRLRDFRVATVFEGTTEIHSIYPALSLIRRITKQMQQEGGGWFSQVPFLVKGLFSRVKWPFRFEERVFKEASRLARSNAVAVRRMLFLGLLLFGKEISRKQFFLRRVTTLSVYAFGILSILSRLTAERKAGRIGEEELDLLRYFLEEAKEERKKNRRPFDSRKEKLSASIFRRFLA